MGHIVNPVNFRLGVSKYWSSIWALSNIKSSYSYLSSQDTFAYTLYWGLFHKRFGYLSSYLKNVLPANIRIYRSYKKITLFLEFYYMQSTFLKYLLFSYFNSVFNAKFLAEYSATHKFPVKKEDLALIQKLKPIFFKWVWLVVVRPLTNKFWKSLQATLAIIFKKYFQSQDVNVQLGCLNSNTISADFLARYISIRLQQGVQLRALLSQLKKSLQSLIHKKVIFGYRISLSGRFSRIQQASTSVSGGGVLSRNEVSANLDYAFRTANLKFSVCGVKVILSRPNNKFIKNDSNFLLSNVKLYRWYNYIPPKMYARWQRGNLHKLLNNNVKGKRNHYLANPFFY